MGKHHGFFKGFLGGATAEGRGPPPCPGAAWRRVRAASFRVAPVVRMSSRRRTRLPCHLGRVGRCVDPGHVGPPLAALGQGGLGRGVPRFLQQGNGLGGKGLAVSWASSCAWS